MTNPAPKVYIILLALLIGSGQLINADEQPSNPAIITTEFIYETAPYPSCHASTIAETPPGHLVAAWFGGTRERAPDVCIWVSRYENGRWSEGVEVGNGIQAEGPRMSTWNPVLFQAPDNGPLILFYKVGPSPSKWWGMKRMSTDGGVTWSPPERLPDGILGPVKNKPIVLSDGTWLSGSSTEGNPTGWLLHFEISQDKGQTWTKIGPVDHGLLELDGIQPCIFTLEDGSLEALYRTKQGVIGQTWSYDNGQSWSPLTAAELPNPNSGFDGVTLKDGRHLLVYNHSSHSPKFPKGPRYPLNIALSDDGIHWWRVLTLESEPISSGYAYPAVIQTDDGLVHITYTWGRRRIKHVVVDPSKLEQPKM